MIEDSIKLYCTLKTKKLPSPTHLLLYLSIHLMVACKGQNSIKLDYTTSFRITAIKDGDTYELFQNNQTIVVRLSHIDCPEKRGKQPFGDKAKQAASDLCFGAEVTLKTDGKKDRNGRYLGEIWLQDGRCVNQELVKMGLAWHYKKYSTDSLYSTLESTARNAKIGLWADDSAIAPWEWRDN
jgi:micrococcal nuclease